MKKLIFPLLVILAMFVNSQDISAKTYYKTFEVYEISSEGIILMDFEGGKFLVKKPSQNIKGNLKVGDSVRYDSVKNVLKKNPWQPGEITEMTDKVITIHLRNGDNVQVQMKSKYRDQVNIGDQVTYNASKGQIKYSILKKMQE